MLQVLLTLIRTVISCFQTHRNLALENLALRHQLVVLQRSTSKRPQFKAADRSLWVLLSRIFSDWQKVIAIVTPETVLRWHREGFKLFWRWKSKRTGRSGRPTIDKEHIQLIRKMSDANPLWGAPRIHG